VEIRSLFPAILDAVDDGDDELLLELLNAWVIAWDEINDVGTSVRPGQIGAQPEPKSSPGPKSRSAGRRRSGR
jgi:hypothetical protein